MGVVRSTRQVQCNVRCFQGSIAEAKLLLIFLLHILLLVALLRPPMFATPTSVPPTLTTPVLLLLLLLLLFLLLIPRGTALVSTILPLPPRTSCHYAHHTHVRH